MHLVCRADRVSLISTLSHVRSQSSSKLRRCRFVIVLPPAELDNLLVFLGAQTTVGLSRIVVAILERAGPDGREKEN